MHYVFVAIPLAITAICYYYSVDAWMKEANSNCARLKELSAECFAPHALAALVFGIGIGLSQIALAWLALRNKRVLETN